jgi:hypothetical protein
MLYFQINIRRQRPISRVGTLTMSFPSLTPERKQLLDAAMDRPFGGERRAVKRRIKPDELQFCHCSPELLGLTLERRLQLRHEIKQSCKTQRELMAFLRPTSRRNEELWDEVDRTRERIGRCVRELFGEDWVIFCCAEPMCYWK